MLSPLLPSATSSSLADSVLRAGLVDADITLVIQAVFFFLLLAVLPGLIFKPMLARMDQREARTDGAREAAKSMRKAAEEEGAKFEAAIAQTRKKALSERAEHRAAAQRQAAETVAAGKAAAAANIDHQIAAQRAAADAARTQLQADARSIAGQIADNIVRA
jgi:F0F1-type ATP synthase membrane subunit b/b'